MIAEPVFVGIRAIQGAYFHPVLPDLRRLGVVASIRALVDYQLSPPPTNLVNLLVHRPLARGG